MPTTCKQEIAGLSHDRADEGIPIASIPVTEGGKGIVTLFSIFWTAYNLEDADNAFTSIQGAPYPGISGAYNVDANNGSIGVSKSAVRFAPDYKSTEFATPAGTLVLTNGFWGSNIRVFCSDITGLRRFRIDTSSLTLDDLVEDINLDVPTNVKIHEVIWDTTEDDEDEGEDEEFESEYENTGGENDLPRGEITLTWDYSNTSGDNPTGFSVVRESESGGILSEEIIGDVPFVIGTTEYTYTDYTFIPGEYTYTIRTYKLDETGLGGEVSPPSPPVVVDIINGLIIYPVDLTLAFEWNSVMAFIVNPSGIYGLIPNKTHDTLYNRGEEDSVDVKIPDPFVKLAFIPEEQ